METPKTAADLPQKYEALLVENAKLSADLEKHKAMNERLLYELLLAKQKQFGRSADVLPEQQLDLDMVFDEAEVTEVAEPEPEPITIESYTRKKAGRKPLSEDIPRIEKTIDIPEADKQCGCGAHKQVIGEEVSEKLMHIPEVLLVIRYKRLTYGCRACEGSGDEDKPAVQTAPVVPAVIPKGIATASLLSTVFANKFIDHLPYYRQEQRFKRLGVKISRQDMSNWQLRCTKVLTPLFGLMNKQIAASDVAHIDETILQVLNEPMRSDTQKGYMWVVRGGPPDKIVYRYHYDPSRSSDVAKLLLNGFTGYLMSDAYGGYKTLTKSKTEGIINVFCWAHSRRKFVDAAKVQKKAGTAHEAVGMIKHLYIIEKDLRYQLEQGEITIEEFSEKRKELVNPHFKKIHKWLEKKAAAIPPETLVGKAIHYTLNNWEQLKRYIEHPRLSRDYNVMEREGIKPFVIGRKNWIFSGSPDGAESSSMLFSLITTAKEHNLNPQIYLYYILEIAPYMNSSEDWETLLPWNVNLPSVLDRSFIEETMDSLIKSLQ